MKIGQKCNVTKRRNGISTNLSCVRVELIQSHRRIIGSHAQFPRSNRWRNHNPRNGFSCFSQYPPTSTASTVPAIRWDATNNFPMKFISIVMNSQDDESVDGSQANTKRRAKNKFRDVIGIFSFYIAIKCLMSCERSKSHY